MFKAAVFLALASTSQLFAQTPGCIPNAKATAIPRICACTNEVADVGNCEGPETGQNCISTAAPCGNSKNGQSCDVLHTYDTHEACPNGNDIAKAELSASNTVPTEPAIRLKDTGSAMLASLREDGVQTGACSFDPVRWKAWLQDERKRQQLRISSGAQ
jgi:hypothetical protein